MFKRLAAGIPALALAAAVGVAVLPAASAAGGEPSAPVITLTPASCEVQENRLTVSNLSDAGASQYRFVLMVNGKAIKQLNTSERARVLSGTAKSAEELLGNNVKIGYGKSVSVKAYWFNNGKDGAFRFTDRPEETLRFEFTNSSLTKAIALSESNIITLTDPAALSCAPAASENGEGAVENQGSEEHGQTGAGSSESTDTNHQEQTGDAKKGADQLPAAPTFELSAAKCEANKAVDNTLTVNTEQKQDNYRFVATHDGKSISLSDAEGKKLRSKLWTNGKLTEADITAAYPNFTVDYTKPLTVQAYWFDRQGEYSSDLYNTTLKLTVGKSDRYIALGDAKTLTLVDPATLNCAPAASAPKTNADDITVPTFSLAAATCDGTKKIDNVLTVDKAQKNDLLRFVATYNGQKVSLKAELRDKLWTNGKLNAADIKAAYPKFTFDYTKPLSVQAYWFDRQGEYSSDLYDTTLKLTVGKSDRYIALGDAKTLTLVDPAGLTCAETAPILPEPKPEVTIATATPSNPAPTVVADGKSTTPVTAKGFTPEGEVKVEIHSETFDLGTFHADKLGALKFNLVVPTTVPAGAHKLVLIDLTSKKSVSADIVVKAAESSKTPDPEKNEGDDRTKQPEKKDPSKPSQTITPEKKDTKAKSKLAHTGFESGLLSLAGFLALGLGTAALATARARK